MMSALRMVFAGVRGERADVIPAGHYSAILRRNPSTSSRMFKEKNLGNSVDDGVKDNGGMCRKAFLGEKLDTQKKPSEPKYWTKRHTCTHCRILFLHNQQKKRGICLTVCSEGQSEPEQGWSPWMQ